MSESREVAILVVDKHPIVREAIASAVQSLVIVRRVSTVTSLAEARLMVHESSFDLLVVDRLAIGKRENMYVDAMKRQSTPLPVLHFGADDSSASVDATRDAGIDGFVSKSASITTFLEAAETLLNGGRYFGSRGHLGDDVVHLPTHSPVLLSQRRQQVLVLVLKGHSNAEIARHLGIAEGTVKSHISTIMRSFDVSNRARLIIKARSLGLG